MLVGHGNDFSWALPASLPADLPPDIALSHPATSWSASVVDAIIEAADRHQCDISLCL